MTDWIEHDGGPQPVADDVWVEVVDPYDTDGPVGPAGAFDWGGIEQFTVLNQHLIDAARLEGIRLGLEAAGKAVEARAGDFETPDGWSSDWLVHETLQDEAKRIRLLDPETLAKEADQ